MVENLGNVDKIVKSYGKSNVTIIDEKKVNINITGTVNSAINITNFPGTNTKVNSTNKSID